MHEYVANIIIQYALNCNDQFPWGLISLPEEISILIYWRTEPKIHLAYLWKITMNQHKYIHALLQE